jgi:4-hydroxy-3-methylbut-2-en-1-yl diphosphate reductase
MSLLVLAPLHLEAAAARRALPDARVVHTGMGHRRAVRAAERVRSVAADGIAVAGLCAGVDPSLRPGDVVVASELRAGTETIPCPAAAPLAAALRAAGIDPVCGPIESCEHLAGVDERSRMRSTGAVAVDMESAWLAGAAAGRPFAALRVVVEPAGMPVADPRVAIAGARALASLRRASAALGPWSRALRPRTVLLAGPRSFCAGVERAIEIVERTLEQRGAPVYVRKQIVHNVHVVADLERRGAVFVDELRDVPEGATVVFSAHGVSPAVKEEASDRGLDVIDATCPLVNKVHAEARRFAAQGRTVFLIGHDGHEEVEGTTGEAPGRIRLVETEADAENAAAEDPDRVAYLTQTTLSVDDTDAVLGRLRRRFPTIAGPPSDDICYATHNRQTALKAVAAESDVILVVGSRTSSNSRRLVEVAEREGTPAHLIDDAGGLDPAWIEKAGVVGLTAGASAPEGLVREVIGALAGLGPVTVEERSVAQESTRFNLPKEVRPS